MSIPMMPDTGTARELLQEIGISVPERRILPIPGGTINTTFRIDQGRGPALFLRIAPSVTEVEAGPAWMTPHGLRRDVEVISMLESLGPILPRVVHTDWSRQLIDRDWVVQEALPGRPWNEVRPKLAPDEDRDIWRQLGRIARAIHAVVGTEFGPPEEGFGHESWSEMVRWDVTGFHVDAQRFGIDVRPFERLTALVNGAVDILDEVTEPRLIHSDLHDRHILIRRTARGTMEISGLIDFEFARFADPFSESVFVMAALESGEEEGFAAFCESYECGQPSRGMQLRSVIYQLIALGWFVMDLHRRGQDDRIPSMLVRMEKVLDEAEGMS